MKSIPDSALRRERWKLTARLVRALDRPMLLLSAVWSVLLVIEFTRGLSPWLQTTSDVIWGTFIAQFVVTHAVARIQAPWPWLPDRADPAAEHD